jgi:alpha-L-fucosidase
MRDQVTELLTNYGKIDIMWFDFSYPHLGKGRDAWQSEKLVKTVRELMPEIILDDRLDLPGSGDVITPEQYQPFEWVTVDGQKVVWEACQTFSGSWGYHRDETSWKSVRQLITMLIDTVGKGGNLLLNVGPTGRGEFDYRAVERLKGIGKWMHSNSRSIYGCTQCPFDIKVSDGALTTYNPETNRLYVHLVNYPFMGYFSIDGLVKDRVEYAQFLHDASEVAIGKVPAGGEHLDKRVFRIPILKPETEIPVVEIFLKK